MANFTESSLLFALSIYLDLHDDVIKWKHFPRYWPFVRGIHRSPVNSPHKGQWHGALMFSLICVWINGWVNNREAGDLRRSRAHYDIIVMIRGLKSSIPIFVVLFQQIAILGCFPYILWYPLLSSSWVVIAIRGSILVQDIQPSLFCLPFSLFFYFIFFSLLWSVDWVLPMQGKILVSMYRLCLCGLWYPKKTV